MLNFHDLKASCETAIGHETSNSTINNVLARHGWRKLMPRPFHPKRDIAAQNAFKNVWPAPLQVVFSSCHDQFASTYPASGLNPGQDGDTRVPVLIKLSASSAIF